MNEKDRFAWHVKSMDEKRNLVAGSSRYFNRSSQMHDTDRTVNCHAFLIRIKPLPPSEDRSRRVIMDSMNSANRKLLLLLAAVLLIPILPFVVMGMWFEPWIEQLLGGSTLSQNPAMAFSAAVGVLAVDILLPIPSTAVCTFAGKELGAIAGTLACWIGLNLSAGIGYWMGNAFGRPLAIRFSDEATLQRLEKLDNRSSVVCILLCRSLPIVAEASVLMMGMKKLPWKLFWPAVLLSNLGIAAALCWLGSFSAKADWFPLALGVSIAIPLLFILFWKAKA